MRRFCAAAALFPAAALAESGGARVSVDLTGVIISLGILMFDLILGWIARRALPAIGDWLRERTTESQRRRMYELIVQMVEAAEQMLGAGRGGEKMEFVIEALNARGFDADVELIEAAVKEMNDRALEAIRREISPELADGG